MRAHIFLDLDGTLTDPEQGIVACIEHALEALQVPVPPRDTLRKCIGPPLRESFAAMAGEQQADAALAIYRERFAAVGLYENRLYPGIPEALARLRDGGARLYVASSKPLVFVERILAHFDLTKYLDGAFGARLDGRLADKTELLRHALERTGAAPGDAAMVGDRAHDMIGARNTGLRAVGVLYGFGSEAELRSAGADRTLASPQELPGALL